MKVNEFPLIFDKILISFKILNFNCFSKTLKTKVMILMKLLLSDKDWTLPKTLDLGFRILWAVS